MIDYHKRIRNLLSNATTVPIYYESFSEKVGVPCVSYLEANNASAAIGNTLSYSSIDYMIKIWAQNIEEIQTIALSIDAAMLGAGFTRTSSYDTSDEGLLVKILRYQATAYEKN